MQITWYGIRRIALGLAGLGLALYVLAGGLLYVFQDKLIYRPYRELQVTPADVGLDFQEASFFAADGVKLTAWYMPLAGSRGTVLFCHGNAGNISHLLEVAEGAHALNLGILLFDYRGYGESEGQPSEQGTHLDAAAAWKYLVGEKGIDPGQIIVVGRSLGGPMAAKLARDHRPAALFLEATFTTLPDVGQELYPIFPVRQLSRIEYPTLGFLADIQCPVLVAHSRDDRLIPFALGRRLYEAAPEPKAFIALRGGHVAAFRTQAKVYKAGVEEFLAQELGW
tara:strand:+ start:353 stop:1195 length:843 start_codon:yes stop_codon:yes gene_type:complete